MGKALIFCGIKHCGKSTLGKAVSEQLALPFRDTDEMLEERFHLTVRELFKSVGEEEFRRRESELLSSLEAETPQVISLGGGALLKAENVPILKKLGKIIWCDVDDRTAFARIIKKGLPPFLAETADPFATFQNSNQSRRAIFGAVCSLRFEPQKTNSPAENAKKLCELLFEKGMIEK
ncbi:MAG: hypothetical protein IJV93_02150 [Lentisphaeria bacterium]|nr:hypothetical protein [Lentisphaeria bacterium]